MNTDRFVSFISGPDTCSHLVCSTKPFPTGRRRRRQILCRTSKAFLIENRNVRGDLPAGPCLSLVHGIFFQGGGHGESLGHDQCLSVGRRCSRSLTALPPR